KEANAAAARSSRSEKPDDGDGETGAGHGDGRGDGWGAAERRPADKRAVGLGERETPPREAAERQAGAQRLLQHPETGDGEHGSERAARRSPGGGQRGADQGDERGLRDRESEPRERADVDAGPGE